MTKIVDELFPTHAPREPYEAIEIGEIPMISEAELKLAVDLLKSRNTEKNFWDLSNHNCWSSGVIDFCTGSANLAH